MIKNSRFPLWVYIFLGSAGLLGAGLVAAAVSKYGPALTHDSVAYLYAAESFLEGKGFQYFGYPSPFIQWPPLFPFLLGIAGLLGVGAITAASFINAIAQGLIVFFGGYWLFSRLHNRIYAVFGTLLLVFSVPILQVSKSLWTETLFVLFFLLFFICFERYFKTKSFKHLTTSGIFAALACLDRYAGVTIILTAALFLLFQKKSFLRRIYDIFIFGFISSLPFVVWVARNYIVSSTLLGVRIPSTYGLKLNILRTIKSVMAWFSPDALLKNSLSLPAIKAMMVFTALLPLVVMALFAVFYLYDSVKRRSLLRRYDAQGLPECRYIAVAFFTAFSTVYIIYLIASATKVLFEPINSRYLIPIYIPAVLAVLSAADILTESKERRGIAGLGLVTSLLLALFLAYPILNTGVSVIDMAQNGTGGFLGSTWEGNELMQYMEKNPLKGTYYSSNADAVYAHTGVRTYSLPKRESPYMYGLEQFKKAVESGGASYIIWFKSGVPASLYNIEDIGKLYKLETIEQNGAGAVYKVVK